MSPELWWQIVGLIASTLYGVTLVINHAIDRWRS
jgi:hypothetical protein